MGENKLDNFFGDLSFEYEEIVKYLNENIRYVAIKFPHFSPKIINDLDILIHKDDWKKLREWLFNQNFKLIRSEKFEKNFNCFKKYIKGKKIISIDIYKEFLGENIILDAEEIIKSRVFNDIYNVFISEDKYEFLITKYQPLLRRREYKEWEIKYLEYLSEKGIEDKRKIKFKRKIGINWINRVLNYKKKGLSIAFVGVDGAGKSTIIKKTMKILNDTSDLTSESVYFGWKPFLFTTKLIDKIGKKKNMNNKETNNVKKNKKQTRKTKLVKNIIYFNYYMEYLLKYLFFVYFKLTRSKTILLDRYICDLFVQDENSKNNKLIKFLLKKLFFKVDFLFYIHSEPEEIYARKKELDLEEIINQENNYFEIVKEFDGIVIENKDIESTVERIMELIWNELAEKMVW